MKSPQNKTTGRRLAPRAALARTASACEDCGKPIPESPENHALCVRCRYSGPRAKAPHQDTDAEGNPIGNDFPLASRAYAVRKWHESREDRFSDALLDAGLNPIDVSLVAKVHEEWLTRFAQLRAIEIVRMILARIAQGKSGQSAEFMAIISIFSPDRSIQDIASEAGFSRQLVHKHVKKLRPLLTADFYTESNSAQTE